MESRVTPSEHDWWTDFVDAEFVQRPTQLPVNSGMPTPVSDDAVVFYEGTMLTSPASVQEELEAAVCLPLATPVVGENRAYGSAERPCQSRLCGEVAVLLESQGLQTQRGRRSLCF